LRTSKQRVRDDRPVKRELSAINNWRCPSKLSA
jgi:hypothetical protein